MPTSASTEFQNAVGATTVNSVVLVFTVGGSDYSSKIVEFPVITRDHRKIVGDEVKFTVPRNDSWIKGVVASKQDFGKECVFSYGFTTAGGDDTITMFTGDLTGVSARGDKASIGCTDKLYKLKDRKIGSDDSDEPFAEMNPATLAWQVMVYWGGLDGTSNDGNTDIDYSAWSSWHSVFDNDNIEVGARFNGQSVLEAMQKIADLTDSVIYQDGTGKLFCHKYIGIGSVHGTLTDSYIFGDVEQTVDKHDLINKVTVMTSYNYANETWAASFTAQNSTSVDSWGEHERVYDDTNVWYVTEAAAETHAERLVFRRHQPNTVYELDAVPQYMLHNVGDILAFTSDICQTSSKYLVVQRMKYDMRGGVGKIGVVLDEGMGNSPAPFLHGFVLDDAVNGLLDKNYNPLIG